MNISLLVERFSADEAITMPATTSTPSALDKPAVIVYFCRLGQARGNCTFLRGVHMPAVLFLCIACSVDGTRIDRYMMKARAVYGWRAVACSAWSVPPRNPRRTSVIKFSAASLVKLCQNKIPSLLLFILCKIFNPVAQNLLRPISLLAPLERNIWHWQLNRLS